MLVGAKCIASSNKCLTSSNKKLLGAAGLTTRKNKLLGRSQAAHRKMECSQEEHRKMDRYSTRSACRNVFVHKVLESGDIFLERCDLWVRFVAVSQCGL